MTGWMIYFEGTIFQGTLSAQTSELMQFSGSGITTRNPDRGDCDPEGRIFEDVAKHFKILPPFTIYLRIWHPSNVPRYQHKKLWVSP
jgi:hypothetical protein